MIGAVVSATAALVVSRGPVLVHNVIVSGDGAAGSADIYDGVSASDDLKMHLEVTNGGTVPIPFPVPVLFPKGLFLNPIETTTRIHVVYTPIDPRELTKITQGA